MIHTHSIKENTTSTPGVLNVAKCKCPRCRTGNLFVYRNPYYLKKTMKMHERCEMCGQPFDIEVGFYYGSSYVSYALGIALSVTSFMAWWVLIGFSLTDNRFFYWLALNAVLLVALQPILMRLARAIWLAFFVAYDKNWKVNPPKQLERTNKDQMNNW
jgi:uncharacterized protein (DUF983 family)